MAEAYIELPTSFSTADTVGPVFVEFSGESLSVIFANFRTPTQKVIFHNVRVFRWRGWENASNETRPDSTYEVIGSELLAPWSRFSVGDASYRHFKLGFNAEGRFLEVVATAMEHRSQLPQ